MPDDLLPAFLEGESNPSERVHAVRRGLSPEPNGEVLGFEVLGDGKTEAHSILCTGGEGPLFDELGIRMNAHGLIDSLADARRAADWASKAGHAEPVAYFPWRLTRYERSTSTDAEGR